MNDNVTNDADLRLRPATHADIPAIRDLIRSSWLGLGPRRYTPEQVAANLEHGGVGVDPQLVEDGTYFVVEALGKLVACGGWSDREKLFGRGARAGPRPGGDVSGDPSRRLDPATEAARIRAFFVAPDWSGRGLGARVLEHCERAAREAGFHRFVLAATLNGEPFYARYGYVAEEPFEADLGGVPVPMVRMAKQD
jgi:GNAT superfamily N-acetyltransferase